MSGTCQLDQTSMGEDLTSRTAVMDANKTNSGKKPHIRTDSGFEDITAAPRSPEAADMNKGKQQGPISPLRKSKRPRSSRKASSTTITPTSRSSSCKPGTTPDSPRPTSSHNIRSRCSSISTTAHRSSRRSSFKTISHQPLPHKDPLVDYIHLHENPFLADSKGVHSFQTILNTPRPQPQLRSPSLPTFPTTFPPHSPPQAQDVEENHPDAPRVYSNYVPATTIDWKSPTTRAKEYAAIDKKCRGLRGFWRKRCRRDREAFWVEEKDDGSDAGSVRRYRINLDAEDVWAQEKEKEQGGEKRRWRQGLWKYFVKG